MRIAIGQLCVSSHCLTVETGGAEGIPKESRICRLCLAGVETEEHYICHSPVYYEIQGRFCCLFRIEPHKASSNVTHRKRSKEAAGGRERSTNEVVSSTAAWLAPPKERGGAEVVSPPAIPTEVAKQWGNHRGAAHGRTKGIRCLVEWVVKKR